MSESEEEFEEEYDPSLDETRSEYEQRLRDERRLLREYDGLAGPKCVAVYQRLIRESRLLTDGEQRLLSTLPGFGSGLRNCFPSLQQIQRRLGGDLRTIARISQLRSSLVDKRFLRLHDLTADDHYLFETKSSGRFSSDTGHQFLLPEGFLAPGEPSWEGPVDWSNRTYGKRARITGAV